MYIESCWPPNKIVVLLLSIYNNNKRCFWFIHVNMILGMLYI